MIARLKAGLTIANLVSAIAAIALLVSPWACGYSRNDVVAANAVVCALLMLAFALAAIRRAQDWPGWMNLTPGLWVAVSPWLLGFAARTEAMLVHVFVGAIVVAVSVIELRSCEALLVDD